MEKNSYKKLEEWFLYFVLKYFNEQSIFFNITQHNTVFVFVFVYLYRVYMEGT